MKLIKKCLTVVLLLLSLSSIAQKIDNQYPKRLYVGDKVDMESIEFNNVRNYPGSKAKKLSDFKGKYIILDFWTKGCTVCIASFPKMEELQNQFKDDIQILLVTKNREEELKALFKNSTNMKNSKLPMIIGDETLARQLFPHDTAPYHVWLDREGKVIATTYGSETNAKALGDLVAGKPINVAVLNEILGSDSSNPLIREMKDVKLSLLKVGNGSLLDHIKYYADIPTPGFLLNPIKNQSSIPRHSYYSMFMEYLPGYVGRGLFFEDEFGQPKGYRIINESLDNLYRWAYLKFFNHKGAMSSSIEVAKIVKEGKSKILYPERPDSISKMRYQTNHSFSYESVLPKYSFEAAQKLLQQDLARFFGMTGKVEERPLKCYVLTRLGTKKEQNLWAKKQNINKEEKEGLERESVKTREGYFRFVNSIKGINLYLKLSNSADSSSLILDETHFPLNEKKKYLDVTLKCKSLEITPKNIVNIQNALAEYGLGLKEETRTFKVLVLSGS